MRHAGPQLQGRRTDPPPAHARGGLAAMFVACAAVAFLVAPAVAAEPPVPQGPGSPAPPPPPPGPGGSAPPPPPPGPAEKTLAAKPTEAGWLEGLSGFWEVRGGVRTQHDVHQRQASIGETRLNLSYERPVRAVTFKVSADVLYDAVWDHHTVDLGAGEGFLDLREAWLQFSPAPSVDVKAGRQILTWGTGDLVFINDLFPKDWPSFFLGRDEDYLKAPSDAVKISVFTDLLNADVVFVPVFNPDRHITGRHVSYWSSTLGRRAGRNAVVHGDEPDECFRDHEWHLRLHRTVGGYELAAYGYWGYWKSPGGQDAVTSDATFPPLNVYGASVRGPVGRGIGNAEVGYYDSRHDRDGHDAYVNNSELRVLFGYEQDLPQVAHDLTVGMQYYLEWMTDYDDYLAALPAGNPARDERRHLLTWRVRKMLMNQNLVLSLFVYYSPSDADAYLRPHAKYHIDDHWSVEVGGNVFFGNDNHTFFGQFERSTNAYAALRYGF